MAIGPGARVGPYEVTALLGVGGMGEVWRARHLELRRDDALKVLPDNVAADPARLARFRREAELLASLNHPNIAQVHGLEEVDGSNRRALVMELVEGRTLADRLAAGPMPVVEALAIAIDIARALEAAHERGIVHRDLKPGNVKIRPDGTVKVLDFGLAKAIEPAAATADDATTARVPPALTEAGVVMGTAAYMSPEQARGEPVDARVDIWAFGCVFYEMLTGRRAFEGANATQTLAAVLGGSPDWSRLPPEVPTGVRALLERCLRRDPRQRVKHISTVILALEDHSVLHTASGEAGQAVPAARPRRGRVALIAAGLFVGLALGAGLVWLARPQAPARVAKMTVLADPLLTSTDRSFALTPDGAYLGYINKDANGILVRSMDSLQPQTILMSPGYLRGLFPSPDARWFGFIDNIFSLRKIPVTGGPAVTVTTLDGPSRGATWGPGDSIVFATASIETGLQQVSASGGIVNVLTRPDRARGEADHVQPSWLPDGRGVLFTVLPQTGGPEAAKVAVFEVASRKWHTVVEVGYGARYVDTGHLVYAAAGALWAVRFDLSRLATVGEPIEVLKPIVSSGTAAVAQFDVASNGTFVYPQNAHTDRDPHLPIWVDRRGVETALPVPAGIYRHPRISPDGKRLAVSLDGDIYVWEFGRPWSAAWRMTYSEASDWFPVWTPNGQQILFGSWRGGGFSNLFIQRLDNPSATRLTDSPDMQMPTTISPDGSRVVFNVFSRGMDMLQLDASGVQFPPKVLIDTPLEERNGAISPNARWLAYEGESSTKPGQVDVYVRPFPDVERGLWQVTTAGGAHPAWGPGGRELFYVAPDGALVAVPVEATETTWRNGSPAVLFRGPYLYRGDGSLGRDFDVAPDGTRFLMLKDTSAPGPSHFVVVQNWTEALRRLFARE